MFGNRTNGSQPFLSPQRSGRPLAWRSWTCVCLLSVALAGTRLPARADIVSAKSDQFLPNHLKTAKRTDWIHVILQINSSVGESKHQQHKDFTAEEQQIRSLGGDIVQRLPLINALAVRIPAQQMAALASLPFVLHLSEDVTVHKHDDFTRTHTGANVALQQYGLDGTGITVAVLDSGIYPHQDLNNPSTGASRILANVDFVPNTPNAIDQCGHGTHVAGIIGGNGSASTGSQFSHTYTGIAPKVNLINVRVLDQNGTGSVSSIIAGVQWCIANQAAYNIRVMNMSVGHPVGESFAQDPLCQAVEQAWKDGIVVVCASGNNGRLSGTYTNGGANEGWGIAYGSVEVPGNDPYVITVGAMKTTDGNRADDAIATYSSRGPSVIDEMLKPDIVAPGNQVISLYCPGGTLESEYPNNVIAPSQYTINPASNAPIQYFSLSGTSMATPVVSGAVALMLQANPSLMPDTIKGRLMMTSDKWNFPNGATDSCTFGTGYLDIPAALACTAIATQPALSPQLVQTSSGTVVISGTNTVCGTNAIWGTNAMWGLNAIWGTNAIWGENTLSASNSIYADSSAWADSVAVADDSAYEESIMGAGE